ncbi:Kinase [Hexamita inflata]|uniref:CAMK CAMKL n=1 Tax=Hexamita inflata TaxID=28002 RepID=A0AA86UE88_9EUKA|nr:CAMK CAMKL [Hexamita inflata]
MELRINNGQLELPGYRYITFLSKGSFIACFKAYDTKLEPVVLIISENQTELQNRIRISQLLIGVPGIQSFICLQQLQIIEDVEQLNQLYPKIFGKQSKVLIGPFYNQDMNTYLKDKTQQQKIELFRKILKVVQELHSRNIYHMDLKPSNIMMQDENPILIDFGNSVTEDEVETVLNTSAYAPKQDVYSCCITSEKFDIYCLGSMLHEILSSVPLHSSLQNNSRQFYQLQQHIGILATDLITGMTKFQQELRYTIEQCIKHPFFDNSNENELLQLDQYKNQISLNIQSKSQQNIFDQNKEHRKSGFIYGGSESIVYSYTDLHTPALKPNIHIQQNLSNNFSEFSQIQHVELSYE